jgi:hypothetical protein
MVSFEICAEWLSRTTRMIAFGGIVGVNVFQQLDELDATVSILGMGKDMARVEINAGQHETVP